MSFTNFQVEPGIGTLNPGPGFVNQFVSQNILGQVVIQQAERVMNHSTNLFNAHQQGVFKLLHDKHENIDEKIAQVETFLSDQEFHHENLLDQVEEFKTEMRDLFEDLKKEVKNVQNCSLPHSMDLSRDYHPGPDQDSNGCLDGSDSNVEAMKREQADILKEFKKSAKNNSINVNTTLLNKAKNGDMYKQHKGKIKSAPNAVLTPGSPESAREKIKQTNQNYNESQIPTNSLGNNEFDVFQSETIQKMGIVPIVYKDPITGHESVRVEKQYYDENKEIGYKPSKSAKKRMRKRRITDANRARCEIVIHKIKETIYEEDDERFWVSETKKFLKWTWEELSYEHLGENGIDLSQHDIKNTGRIYVWTGIHDEENPLPMVVEFHDEITCNEVKRAMVAAGCFKHRVHLKNIGKYKNTGDKKIDKKNAELVGTLPWGRPSSTKVERDAARRKWDYINDQVFTNKSTYQEFKGKRDVNHNYIKENYIKVDKNGEKDLIKKPKSNSNIKENENNTEIESNISNDYKPEEHYIPNWFVGDHCRIKCDFDGLVHGAKLIEQDYNIPGNFKLLIKGYGKKENKHCSLFMESKKEKARLAQIKMMGKNPTKTIGSGNTTPNPMLSNEEAYEKLRKEDEEILERLENISGNSKLENDIKVIEKKIIENKQSSNQLEDNINVLEKKIFENKNSLNQNLEERNSNVTESPEATLEKKILENIDNSDSSDKILFTSTVDDDDDEKVIFNGRTAPLDTPKINPEETEMTDGRTALPAAANANKTNAYQQEETEMTDGRTALPAAANANKTNAYQQGETELAPHDVSTVSNVDFPNLSQGKKVSEEIDKEEGKSDDLNNLNESGSSILRNNSSEIDMTMNVDNVAEDIDLSIDTSYNETYCENNGFITLSEGEVAELKDPYKNLLKSADSTLNNLEALDQAFAEEEETTPVNEIEIDPISASENKSNGEEIEIEMNNRQNEKDQNDDGKIMTRSMSVLKSTDIMPQSVLNSVIQKGTKNIS